MARKILFFSILMLLLIWMNKFEFLLADDEHELPDAIIIGAKKCGTRALIKFIGNHPNVRTAGAEIHFFDKFYNLGIDWYK